MDELTNHFHDNVALKYSLYNSLFLTLPFQKMQEVGTLLTFFAKYAAVVIKQGRHPRQIVDHFFKKNLNHLQIADKISILFTMLQFVERQIVLFDALEDAAYATTHSLHGPGTLTHLINKTMNTRHEADFIAQIQDYRIKIVLTAHPTQFYPAPVLGIINQLTVAIQHNNLKEISDLLWQMGKTSFKHQQKPTPYQEAQSLVWYVENIFYPVIPRIHQQINAALKQFRHAQPLTHPCVELGFWPGGDRDGNPHVDGETTLAVAKLLKTHILQLYAQDLRQLSKKLTFKGILDHLYAMATKHPSLDSFDCVYQPSRNRLTQVLHLTQSASQRYLPDTFSAVFGGCMPDLDSSPTGVQRPAKAGRWRFGLRTLLIAVTLLAVTIGTWAESARRQRRAVAALLRCHANVQYETFSGPAERRWFQTGPAGKPWEERLGMDFLYPVRDVTVFSASPVLDEEEFLPHIAALRRVRLLSLGDMPITNKGLRYLQGLRQLTVLDLASTKINEADVDHLQGLNLTWLSVFRTRFSDRSLASLRDMHSLTHLNLSRTKVSDQGLDILRGLPNLREVRLDRSLVTEAGYHALQRDLPSCTIHWEPLLLPSPLPVGCHLYTTNR